MKKLFTIACFLALAGSGLAHSVKLTWNPVTTYSNGTMITQGAIAYEIWRSPNNNLSNAVKIGDSVTATYMDGSAIANKNYWYFVKCFVVYPGSTMRWTSANSNVLKIRA